MDISYYTINHAPRGGLSGMLDEINFQSVCIPWVCWYKGWSGVEKRQVGKAGAPELLAPAGGLDQLLAAVAAGAGAVYAGLGGFNARVSAHGFTDEEFARGVAVAHAHGVRVYVTLNVFVFDDELDAAVALGRRACGLGADALIVADPGLVRALRDAMPGVEIHLSTQSGVHSPAAVELVARELGVERVTTARELAVDEIAGLCATGVPIEVFCHGAICIGYSGACEFSALRRGRSAMRGDCTQPCRLSYGLADSHGRECATVEGDKLLCPRDYLGLMHLPELLAAGVASLKIEGRMKNPDYVYNVVRCWRRALDMAVAGTWDEGAARGIVRELGRSFNRGFTDAYLRGRSGAELMSFERSCNQGVRVGRLAEVGREEAVVALDAPVAAGDTLEIRFYPGEEALPDVPKRWPQVPCPVDAAAGESVRVRCKRKVDAGCEVYLIRSAGVLAETATVLERMRAEAAAVELPGGWERAGDVPVAVADRSFGPKPAHGGGASADVFPEGEVGAPGLCTEPLTMAATPAEAARILAVGEREVGVYAWRLPDSEEGWAPLLGWLTVVLDEVCRAGDEARARGLMRLARRVVCRNLGEVAIARELGVPFDVAAPIFCANRATLAWLRGLGAERAFLSVELVRDEGACARVETLLDTPGVMAPVDAAAPELMVSEHCLLTAEGPCAGEGDARACASCARHREERFLVERDGTRLVAHVDVCGRTRIFQA